MRKCLTAVVAVTAIAIGGTAVAQEGELRSRDEVRSLLREQGYSDIGDIRHYYTATVRNEEGERVRILVQGDTALVREAETGRLTEEAAVRLLEERGLENIRNVRYVEEENAYRADVVRGGYDVVAQVNAETGIISQIGETGQTQATIGDQNGQQTAEQPEQGIIEGIIELERRLD